MSNFYKTKYQLLFMVISLFISNELYGQKYSFSEIKEVFLKERPQIGDLAVREDCFGSIDDLILGTYPPLHPDTKLFYTFMFHKALLEIENETVTDGATIWQLYNHGFVVKTPSVIFGCDLNDFFSTKIFLELANIIDAYFISHQHGDHYSIQLINAMNALGKPVVGPAEFSLVPIKMNAGESSVIAGLTVTAHDGLHSVPLRQFEIITPEGFKFLHTGDNQTSETLPSITDIDVMLLNSWINESGAVSWIEGVRIAINKMNPKVTLPGHMMELGHLGSSYPPVPYRDAIASDNGTLASEYYILAWGERYHYDHASNDTVKPNIVDNLTYTFSTDTIGISWDTPLAADDGDTGSFYRVIINDTDDFLISDQQFNFPVDMSEKYNIKVFSYDDCGNQSETYAEIEEIDPNNSFENGAVRFEKSGDHVLIPHADILAPTQITIECWIYLNGETGEQTILDKRDDNGGYNLRIDGGNYPLGIAVVMKGAEESILAVGDIVNHSTWYHVAATYDGNEIRLFLNGELLYTKNVSKDISNTQAPLIIGEFTGYPWDSFVFHGLIDDLRIWNVARTQEEIKSTKDDFLTGNESHLIGYWKFDENVGTLISDSSPNQNNGTLKGNARTVPSTAPVGATTEIGNDIISTPQNFILYQNYPNPFNSETVIKYQLVKACDVTFKIYNMLGQEITTLLNEKKNLGFHQIHWNGKDNNGKNTASGLYIYQVSTVHFVKTRKMILLR